MNTHGGYSKKKLDNTLVLLAGGGEKSLTDFLGSIRISSSKIQYKAADSAAAWTDLITLVNTDENVKLAPKTDNVDRPLMMINGGTSAGELISTSMFSTGIYANASAKSLTVTGDICTNSKLVFPHGGSTYSWERINEGYSRTSIRAYCTAGEAASGAKDNYSIGLMIDGYYSFALAGYDGGAKLAWRNSSGTWYDIYHSGNLPAYPTVNNALLTLQTDGTTQTTFYANDSTNKTFNVTCANIGAAPAHNHPYLPLAGGTLYNNTTSHSIDTLNATANSADAWNKDGNALLRLGASNNLMIITLGGADNERKGLIQVGHSDYGTYAWCTGILHLNKLGGEVYINNSLAWHAGNDGSGSTLDADLLDGKHLSELFTDLSRPSDTNNISITVGGITKSVTLGSRAWDNTAYLPLSGGTMTGNITMGGNYIKWTSGHTSNWNITGLNTGIRLLNTVGASATGAPTNYSIGLHVMGYYGFLLACTDATNTFRMRSLSDGRANDLRAWVTLYHTGNLPAYPTKDSWNYDDRYVTALGISDDYVTWTKNGTTNSLTVPYAIRTTKLIPDYSLNVNACSENLVMRLYYNLNVNNGYAGADNSYGFPCSNNANGILWIPVHGGSHGGQFGISSNSHLYYRYISGGSFPTTTNGGSWNRIAWYSEIPTSMAWSSITSKPDTATRWPKWSEITDKITSKTIWGQTYIDASGNFLDVSGWINNVSGTFEFPTYGNSKGIRVFSNAGSASTGSPNAYCVGLCVSGYYSMHLAAYGGGDSTTLWWKNTEGSWREIIHSGNYTSYCATASHTHPYLPLTGGTLNRSMHSVHTLDKTNGGDNAWNKPDNALLRLESGNNLMILSIGSPSNERHGIIQVGHNSWGSYATVVSNLSLNPLGGSVGIGKTTGINYTLDINGNCGATNFYTTSGGFHKSGSSDSYVLLGGGGHKAISDFAAAHDHPYVRTYSGTDVNPSTTYGYWHAMTTQSGITGDWWHIIHMDWSGAANWRSELALPTQHRKGVYYRSDNWSWCAWERLYDSSYHPVTWIDVSDKLHGGNEFNIVHAGFSSTNFWFNYLPWDNRSSTASISTYIMGNGATGYADVTARHFYDASDIRLKENIKSISNLFPIREFTWKSDKTKSYGFIAQELQLLGLNELVQRNDKTEMLTVNYLSALCLYLALLSNIVEKQLKEILELKLELKKIKKD